MASACELSTYSLPLHAPGSSFSTAPWEGAEMYLTEHALRAGERLWKQNQNPDQGGNDLFRLTKFLQ